MIYRALDGNADYSFGKGLNNFLSGTNAVAQAVKTNLLLLKGEWWEDLSEGLSLYQSILGQPGTESNLKAVDLLVQDRILSTQGVTGIESFEHSYANRKYSATCTLTTQYSTTTTVNITL